MCISPKTIIKKIRNYLILDILLITSIPTYVTAFDLDNFNISGNERIGWVTYDYGNPNGNPIIHKGHKDSQGFYLIPKISLQTLPDKDLSGEITVSGVTDFGLNNESRQQRNFVFDPVENKSFMILQELNIKYQVDENSIVLGRSEFITPMIESDDWYMLANSFELANYTNTSFNSTKIHIGYFDRMSGVWDSGSNGTKFHKMSDASFVPQLNKDEAAGIGVYYAATEFNNTNHYAKLWEYYAPDLYNILFTQYNYKNNGGNFDYDFGLQFIDWQQVGKLKASPTEIDYNLYSIKYDADFKNGFSFASGISKYSDGDGQGATLGAWGGYPYFANGMIFHFFEAGSLRNASSYKVQVAFDLARIGIENTVLKTRYTSFDLDPNHSIGSDGQPESKMNLLGIQLSYAFLKTGYFNATMEQHDLDKDNPVTAIRLIGGYRF